MSKNTISASATGLPSRRLFLSAGPAAAVFMSLRKAAAEESPLETLIAQHKAADEAFVEMAEQEDRFPKGDPRKKELSVEVSRLSMAEDDAITNICAYPSKSMQEARSKAEYLASYFDMFAPMECQVEALLRSFMV